MDRTGLRDRVHLLGHVSNPLGVIREATVFVMSSREEGLGTSVLDAMALDVPVVATRAGGIPEMLDGGAGQLVDVADAPALAREVGRVITEPSLATQLPRNRPEAVVVLHRHEDGRGDGSGLSFGGSSDT